MERDLEKAEFLCRFGGDLFALDNHLRNPSKVDPASVTRERETEREREREREREILLYVYIYILMYI
jgi:hypothetical protein